MGLTTTMRLRLLCGCIGCAQSKLLSGQHMPQLVKGDCMSAAEKSLVRDVAIYYPRCEGAVSKIVLLMAPTA